MTKHNLTSILEDINNGVARKQIIEKHGISASYLSRIINKNKSISFNGDINKQPSDEKIAPANTSGEILFYTESEDSKHDESKSVSKTQDDSKSDDEPDTKHDDSYSKSDDEADSKHDEPNTKLENEADSKHDEPDTKLEDEQDTKLEYHMESKHDNAPAPNLNVPNVEIPRSPAPYRDDSIDFLLNTTDACDPPAKPNKKTQALSPIAEEIPNKDNQCKKNKNRVDLSLSGIQKKNNCVDIGPIPIPDVDIKKHRQLMLIIRNYCENFPEKLKDLLLEFGNRRKFYRSLYTMNIDRLNSVLQMIRTEMSCRKSVEMFHKVGSVLVKGIESSSKKLGIDLEGLSLYCENSNFQESLTALACEYSLDINVKHQLMLDLTHALVNTYHLNKQKKAIPKTLTEVLNKHKLDLKDNADSNAPLLK